MVYVGHSCDYFRLYVCIVFTVFRQKEFSRNFFLHFISSFCNNCYRIQVGVAMEISLGLLELLGDCTDIWACMKLLEATQTGTVSVLYI